MSSSINSDTNQRPLASRLTVTVLGSAVSGKARDHTIFSGLGSLARKSFLSRYRNPLVVNSALCVPCLLLNVGYPVRFAQKLENAVCRWRKDCCKGTLETSFKNSSSGSFFQPVSAVLDSP